MASGATIQKKIAATLRRLNATARVVKFRAVSASGGNALLGVGQDLTVTDTVCDPQPAVEVVKPDEIGAGTSSLQLGDYRMTFAGSEPESTFQNSEIVYGTDVLKIISWSPAPILGVVASWTVIARSSKVA